jgi:two-component system, NtrC family, sensor kinase
VNLLQQKIKPIEQAVAHQTCEKDAGILENIGAEMLVEDALRLASADLTRHQIIVVREFRWVPDLLIDRYKVLQILINLINNAQHALDRRSDARILKVRIGPGANGNVRIEVTDNGVGIPKENLLRVFQFGFTTKRSGRGFGLHSGANTARQLGGWLTALSDGVGLGSTFILELPTERSVHSISA